MQQLFDPIFTCIRWNYSILEDNFLDQLKPMDLIALQADWVDDYCPKEEGLGEHKQEEKREESVEDEKKDLKDFPSSSIYSHSDCHDVST